MSVPLAIAEGIKMDRPVQLSKILLLLTFILHVAGGVAQPGGLVPVFTSPIDITGFKTQLHAVAPDRNTGTTVDVALPIGLLPPAMNVFFTTPLSAQIDQAWNVTPDPATHMTQRDLACNGPKGIVHQLQSALGQIGSGISAVGISCNLASTGKLLLQQTGSVLTLGYLLTNNTVSFSVTTPATCASGHGTPFCPTDPHFKVTFAAQIVTTVRVPALCQFSAEPGTVNLQALNVDSSNGTADLIKSFARLFVGNQFTAAVQGLENSQTSVPLPLEAAFRQFNASDPCANAKSPFHVLLGLFRGFDVAVKPPQGIVFTMTHPPLLPPIITVPNPGAITSPQPAPQPSFTRPTISANRPSVAAGSPVQIVGSFFPSNQNLSTALPVTLSHPGLGGNSEVLGGPCPGGGTDLRFGPGAGATPVQRLPSTPQASCAVSFIATGLTPATPYQFSARDCDLVTCSLFGAPVRVTTARGDGNQGRLNLSLDAGIALGSTVLTPSGTFDTGVTIPAGVAPGNHQIRAVSGSASASLTMAVTGTAAPGGRGTLTVIALLFGESGCPNHPIQSTEAGSSFTLFGTGFQPGAVAVRLDALSGVAVGTATAKPDGSFCQVVPGVPASQVGRHTLLGVQNGAIQGQTTLTFVPHTIVR